MESLKIMPYVPEKYVDLPRLTSPPVAGNPDAYMAWRGLDRILTDVLDRFGVSRKLALEFGVEFGYSASALACLFKEVVGVDTFTGDKCSGFQKDHFLETSAKLAAWPNVTLHQSDYKQWIQNDGRQYDFIHVDIVHTYEDTLACGLWSVNHAPVVIFHDTESFPEVKKAVSDIAVVKGMTFYNYEKCNGLGILKAETSVTTAVRTPVMAWYEEEDGQEGE